MTRAKLLQAPFKKHQSISVIKSLAHHSSGLTNAEASEGSGTEQKEQRIDGNFEPVSLLTQKSRKSSYFYSKCAVKLKSVRRQMGLFQQITNSPAVCPLQA